MTQGPSTSTSEGRVSSPNPLRVFWKPEPGLTWAIRDRVLKDEELDAEGKKWLEGFIEPRGLSHLSRAWPASRSGRLVATHGRSKEGRRTHVDLWTIEGKLLHSLKVDGWTPTAVTFSHDDAQLLVAYRDEDRKHWLRLWDTKTGSEIRTLAAPSPNAPHTLGPMTLSPNERYVAINVPPTLGIHLIDLESGESIHVKRESGSESHDRAIFSPDSKRVFCLGHDRMLWDVAARKQLADFGRYNGAYPPIFSPNGRVLLVKCREHEDSLWNAETGDLLRSLKYMEIHFSRDGTRLLANRRDNKPYELWDFQSGKKICELRADSAAGVLRDAFFTPNGRHLVTTYANGLTTWNTKSGKRLTSLVDETLPFDFRSNQQNPFFLPDAKRFVTVHANGAVVWDLDTGKPIHRFATPAKSKTETILAPGGETLLVVARGREATLWDLETGKEIRTFSPLPPDTEKVWFNDDGTRLFSRHQAGQAVFMWDVPLGRSRGGVLPARRRRQMAHRLPPNRHGRRSDAVSAQDFSGETERGRRRVGEPGRAIEDSSICRAAGLQLRIRAAHKRRAAQTSRHTPIGYPPR